MVWDVVSAHKHANNHSREIWNSTFCGCFYCRETFLPTDIDEWIDGGNTAMCPLCGIDSVIGDASGYPVTESTFLESMNLHWFAYEEDVASSSSG